MANKIIFIKDLRESATRMIDAYQEALTLCQQIQALGWSGADLDGALTGTGSDLTGNEILQAITALEGVAATYAANGPDILKLKI